MKTTHVHKGTRKLSGKGRTQSVKKSSKNDTIDASDALEQMIGEPFSFATLLQAHRTRHDLTQAQLAKKLRVGVSYVSDLENKRRRVSVEQAIAFAKALGQDPIYFARLALQDMVSDTALEVRVELSAI